MNALNTPRAIDFIKSKGIPMSKSRIYKMTSTRSIIHHHSGNRLIFYEEELDKWCQENITTPTSAISSARFAVIQSAQKQIM